MADNRYLVGLDFGTDSVRAVAVNAADGREEANQVSYYGRWRTGRYCDPEKNRFRQHPLDYVEAMEEAVKGALAHMPAGSAARVAGIGIDTTGSTPCAVDREGAPLALRQGFEDNPNAMFVLWKDHTAVAEAAEINELARSWGGTDFTKYEGGIYSTEWFWAKILHVLRQDEAVREAAFSWVEHCDWMTALLTGTTDPLTMKRSRCAAGHKAMWHAQWGGLPAEDFLRRLDPLLTGLRARLYEQSFTSDQKAGGLTDEWAARLGLPAGTPVAVGAFDAHMGAVGGGVREGVLAKIMGTSTCDMTVIPAQKLGDRPVAGIAGQVDGSIIPGMIGLEAGQSSFGDVYAWFVDLLYWPLQYAESAPDDPARREELKREIKERMLANLTEEAQKLAIDQTGLVSLDWLNGRRTPDADQRLKGAVAGLTLGTTAPKIFRALVEATAFGARAINERFAEQGVPIEEVVAQGGISQKSPFVVQVTADVLDMPIKVVASEQSVALGAAMFAAVAAGLYDTVTDAQEALSSGFSRTYTPDPRSAQSYRRLYERYRRLGGSLEELLREL